MGAVYPLLNIYLTGLDPLSGSIEPRPCRLLWGNFASPRAAPQKFSARRPPPRHPGADRGLAHTPAAPGGSSGAVAQKAIRASHISFRGLPIAKHWRS
jgi:hypothetical protein